MNLWHWLRGMLNALQGIERQLERMNQHLGLIARTLGNIEEQLGPQEAVTVGVVPGTPTEQQEISS